MEWLNYHHLRYFWMVAREGSVTRASELMRLAQPTLTGQIRALEESLGEKLFARSGRRLVLTEAGRVVYRYADQIFGLGQELLDQVKGEGGEPAQRLVVGVSDVLPKRIAYRLLAPALSAQPPAQIVCVEGKVDRLVADLAIHEIDLVLADRPIGEAVRVKAFNHLLGESAITFFAPKQQAPRYRRRFPQSLDGAPFLLPTGNTAMRRELDAYFERNAIRPKVVAEFEDSALLEVFGEQGAGLFAAPSVVEDEIRSHYGVHPVGCADEVTEKFFAITVERRITHPAVAAISEAARGHIFNGRKS